MIDLEKQLEDIWKDDKLSRAQDAEIIRKFSQRHLDLRQNGGLPKTYVLNINSDWGSGKTFFLTRLKEHLQAHGHISVYINAWEDDHSADPFMTVVDAIHDELVKQLPDADASEKLKARTAPFFRSAFKIVGSAAFVGGKHLATRYIGQAAIDQLAEFNKRAENEESPDYHILNDAAQKAVEESVDAAGQEMLNNFRTQKAAQIEFQKQLVLISKEALSQKGVAAPIFVLIDELDRCRPSYSVELLERVKHIFSLPNFVFVLGTDTKQLAHTVEGLYGSGFDGKRYLNRFIDRTYKFQPVSTTNFVEFTLARLGLSNFPFSLPARQTPAGILSQLFSADGIELRDAEQILEMVSTFVAIWPYEDSAIDLFNLVKVVYLRHFDIPSDQIRDSEISKVCLYFQSYESPGNAEYTIMNIWDAIENASNRPPKRHDPSDEFQNWLLDKLHSEERAYQLKFKERKPPHSITKEYQSLLHRVTNIDD